MAKKQLSRQKIIEGNAISANMQKFLETVFKSEELTAEDVKRLAVRELDDDDPDAVAGGVDSCACSMGGGTKDGNGKT